ncbi:MAG: cobalamin ABC transporter substrate-binding protein [Myxococcota bacterium]
MDPTRRNMVGGALAWGATTTIFGACRGSDASGPAQNAAGWPRYEGDLRVLFDDAITLAAVGLAMDGASPLDDPLLRRRAFEAELTARVRVQTVTVDVVGAVKRFTLGVEVGQPPLIAPRWETTGFELEFDPQKPGYRVLEQLGGGLRGRTFVAFAHRFAGTGGLETHVHFTADVDEVHRQIQQWRGLSAFE